VRYTMKKTSDSELDKRIQKEKEGGGREIRRQGDEVARTGAEENRAEILWREKKREREQDANINRRGEVQGRGKKKKSQHCRKERGPWGGSGCRRGVTGPRGPGTHRSSHSQRCQETLPFQIILSPSLLPSSSVSPVTWLSSTQEETCMSRSSYETRLPRHIASLSDVLCTGNRTEGKRERV